MSLTQSSDPPQGRVPVHPVLWLLIAVMAGFEVMFWAAGAGWLPGSLGRWPVYEDLAFLDLRFAEGGLQRVHWISDYEAVWRPAGPAAFVTLLTHAFLHGGWLHLALNGAPFLGLGHVIVRAIGVGRFLLIFGVTAVSGAVFFWQIAHSPFPMVGASGVVFGLFAVVTAWQERALRVAGRSRAPIWKRIGALVVLNVVLHFALQGMLAWEAHLGGWIAGWVLALAMRPGSEMVSPMQGPGRPGAEHRADPVAAPPPEPPRPPNS